MPNPTANSAVIIRRNDDRWLVTVIENGKSHQTELDVEADAKSFAAGESLRLGLSAPSDKPILDEDPLSDGLT